MCVICVDCLEVYCVAVSISVLFIHQCYCLKDASWSLGVQVDFERPVDVGDLVTFESQVVHTRPSPDGFGDFNPMQLVVQVKSMVNQPDQRRAFSTNTFTMMCGSAPTLMLGLPAEHFEASKDLS
jgi:hypothetical protein